MYQKYNALIDENEYGIKYDIPHAHMFVIEGMEKVRDVIEKHRKRKLTKHMSVMTEGNFIISEQRQKKQADYTQTFEVYGCADCSGCIHKAKCLYKYDAEKDEEKNKVMKINEQWETLKEESHANIQSEKGILNRQIRSIKTEGHFGDIKGNDNFRRFNYRTAEKVYKEFMLYAMGRNINKYHRFLHDKIQKFEGKNEEKAA